MPSKITKSNKVVILGMKGTRLYSESMYELFLRQTGFFGSNYRSKLPGCFLKRYCETPIPLSLHHRFFTCLLVHQLGNKGEFYLNRRVSRFVIGEINELTIQLLRNRLESDGTRVSCQKFVSLFCEVIWQFCGETRRITKRQDLAFKLLIWIFFTAVILERQIKVQGRVIRLTFLLNLLVPIIATSIVLLIKSGLNGSIQTTYHNDRDSTGFLYHVLEAFLIVFYSLPAWSDTSRTATLIPRQYP